ncbi:MAG: hypothetical protein UU48_C0005G0026 [Candidatus Uhrbacteria bacterium GW2011_GWF2_41_16]|uniref:Lipoprotein n=2 Tax=Candidatus Uhriibacteriota TaxID=1752732 RepID=A0A0G0XN02_9BACT|nr:MAG: hypothetical protein UU31_C0001G0026 [Candidatus Uhrbacteria bacterium GW2011_GWA2_41_10]KKR87252.1 MAG: hypothetical protein UU35_C0004G0025 [Candidatus Uhrbacteria bacterium GW2011_GWC2_41_11]KKR98170.1 MAG: hypothetical protein UU48_C0005G0026 [Candidatus Uhrbacteria bacterium GW2011_GWF2_41_16]
MKTTGKWFLLTLALFLGGCGLFDGGNANDDDDQVGNLTPTPTQSGDDDDSTSTAFSAKINITAPIQVEGFVVNDELVSSCKAGIECLVTVSESGTYEVLGQKTNYRAVELEAKVSENGAIYKASWASDQFGLAPDEIYLDEDDWEWKITTIIYDIDNDGFDELVLDGFSVDAIISLNTFYGVLDDGGYIKGEIEDDLKTIYYYRFDVDDTMVSDMILSLDE